MCEVWREVSGYEGLYDVSNFGNIRSRNYRTWGITKNLTPKINNKGYLYVFLTKNKECKCKLVHRLVAEAFLENKAGLPIVNHRDANPFNNNVENLEWCTQSYNVDYYIINHSNRERRKKSGEIRKDQLPVYTNKYKVKKTGRTNRRHNIEIVQLSVDDEVIGIFKNARDVVHVKGYNEFSITECCDGRRKTAYGYKWRYAQ